MNKIIAAAIIIVLYALHQDVWLWRQARPLVFGVLPVGLAYHVGYALVTSLALWLLVRLAWPANLDPHAVRSEGDRARTE
jgi:hypothetical protein